MFKVRHANKEKTNNSNEVGTPVVTVGVPNKKVNM